MDIAKGNKFLMKGDPRNRRPDRIYEVLEIRSKWDIRCSVDPPLAKGSYRDSRTALVSQESLNRMERL